MLKLSGYKPGDNITIMNSIYHYGYRDEEGKLHDDTMTIVFKDLNDGKKYMRVIHKPTYTYYVIKDEFVKPYQQFFIEADKVDSVTVPYADLEKSIAETLGMLDFFYDNIKCGNRRANQQLHLSPRIMGSDMHINNYYRQEFDKTYQNQICTIYKCYFDIEEDITYAHGDFPEPGECPINAISLYFEENDTLYTLLLDEPKNKTALPEFKKYLSENDFHSEFMSFLTANVGGWKNLHRFGLQNMKTVQCFYSDEIELIANAFKLINTIQPDFVLAWNMAFDIPHVIARIVALGYDPRSIMCHPDFPIQHCKYFIDERNKDKPEQRGDYADISSYSIYLDQLIQFASRRKGQSAFASFSLDYIGGSIAHTKKLDYKDITTDLGELPYLDFKIFTMYNMMDVLVQRCIEDKTGDISYVFNKALDNNTMYPKVHRQTVYLANRMRKLFLQDSNLIAGNNRNIFNEKPTEKYEGAFVANSKLISDKPKVKLGGVPILLTRNSNDFDYKRLYPSITQQNNMAPNTVIGKINIPDKIWNKENPLHNPKYNRSGNFIEDLVTKNWINFGHRWFGLPDYLTMYHNVIEYWTKNKTSFYGITDLHYSSTGLQDIAYRTNPNMQIAYKFDGLIPIVDRYRIMPENVKENTNKIIGGIVDDQRI